MKYVDWIDENGKVSKRAIKDNDPDELAKYGIPIESLEPPDIEKLDWQHLKRELFKQLEIRGLTSWLEVQRSQNGVTSAILATFRKEIINLYKEGK